MEPIKSQTMSKDQQGSRRAKLYLSVTCDTMTDLRRYYINNVCCISYEHSFNYYKLLRMSVGFCEQAYNVREYKISEFLMWLVYLQKVNYSRKLYSATEQESKTFYPSNIGILGLFLHISIDKP